MAGGKWIDELTSDTPLKDAAARVLSLRLKVVRASLDRVLNAPDEDPEDVHQLRVGTRRAAAALEIFASCLPSKVCKRARRRLRMIRRAAGQVRDWDIFLATLWEHRQTPRTQPGLDFLMGFATARRGEAQALLVTAGPEFRRAFERSAEKTLAAVHTPDSGPSTLIDLALPGLCDLLSELSRAATCDLSDPENLHRVRLIGKRLRYAMEVFAGCFAPPFREKLYPVMEEMQEILGRANDSFVAGQRLEGLRDLLGKALPADGARYQPGIEALLHEHRQRLPQQRDQFLKWWDLWRHSGNDAAVVDRLRELQMVPSGRQHALSPPGPRAD